MSNGAGVFALVKRMNRIMDEIEKILARKKM